MTRSLTRTLPRLVVTGALVSGLVAPFAMVAADAAGTAPGTTITNTATASYTDGNGNAYNTISNSVATFVQNSPSVAVNNPGPQNVSPNETVVDPFVITNTGNGAGNFTNVAAAVGTGNSTGTGSLVGFTLANDPNCTVAAPCSAAQLQTDLQTAAFLTQPGGTQNIGVVYKVTSAATSSTTPVAIVNTLTAQIAQAATTAPNPAGGTVTVQAVTSAPATGTETDGELADARLDIQKSTGTFSGTQAIPFTITANDGGAFGVFDLKSAQALFGAPKPGVFISDQIPVFAGAPLAVATAPTCTLAAPVAGQTATVYFSTNGTAWTTTAGTTVNYVACYISGAANGIEFPSAPGGSAGAARVTTPQVTLAFSVAQPAGPGSGNSGAITNLANSAIGGNPTIVGGSATPISPVIFPGESGNPTDNGSASTVAGAVTNKTPGTPGNTTAPGGASNQVATQAVAAATVFNGPAGSPQAAGSYSGSSQVSNSRDFTDVSFACAAAGGGAAPSVNNGTTQCIIPAAGITVPGTVQNGGNAADTLTLSLTAPAGFTATIYAATCPAGAPYATFPTCTRGAQIGTGAAGTTVTASLGSIAANGTADYVVVYTPSTAGSSSVPPFTQISVPVTVSGTQSATVANDANSTYQELFPGGPVSLTKTQTVVSTGCPAGAAPAPPTTGTGSPGVCPGGVIQYGIKYVNNAPAGIAPGGVGLGTGATAEPAFATNGVDLSAGSLLVTEDGAANPGTGANTWATYTYGVNSPGASDSTTGTTFAYSNGPGFYSTGSTTAGYTKLVATVGGASFRLAPGATGTIVFNVTVK